jgi:thiamine-phosphate diphosphorylase
VLCLVTDRRRTGSIEALVGRIAAAAAAGVQLVQVREPDLDDRALLDLVRRAVAAVRGSRTRVLVNDRLDVAMAGGAHGVHLRSTSVPAGRARAIAPSGFLLGRSVHAAAEAAEVSAAGGLDYLLFGTVFATGSKPGHPAAGVAALAAAVTAAPRLPVLAIGGVSGGTVARLPASRCAGLAAIGWFAEGPDAALPAVVAAARAAWQDS